METETTPPRVLRELPPRRLDWYSMFVMLFGDWVTQFGWLLVAMGSISMWTPRVQSELTQWWEQRRVEWQKVPGTVVEVGELPLEEKGVNIWWHRYTFKLAGETYEGISYHRGKKFDPGQIAYIHYDPDWPWRSYIIGLRRNPRPAPLIPSLIVLVLGIVLVVAPLRRRLHQAHLLKIGEFTRGNLVSKEPTGKAIREGSRVLPEYKYLFQFEYQGTFYLASCSTHHTQQVEDEEAEIILFNPRRPTDNLVFDALTNAPSIDERGHLAPPPPLKSWTLFLPIFTIACNLLFVGRELLEWFS